jgi:hypothetical protein
MIDLDTAANIAEISGGIAILVSLIYVGYQIRQSNRIARAAALQAILDGFSERLNKTDPEMFEIQNRGYLDWVSLHSYEKEVFNIHLVGQMLHFQNVMQLHDHGLISDTDYAAWATHACTFICTPGGSDWWKEKKSELTPTLVAAIDGHLSRIGSVPSRIEIDPWRIE